MIAKSESFPKKIKSLFSTHQVEEYEDNSGKRSSCHSSDSSSKKFRPATWFTHIRNRSSSSSITFSTSPTTLHNYSSFDNDSYYQKSNSLFDSLSTELNDLYSSAKEELFYALESHGSIYYEGDKSTAENAYSLCEMKYNQITQLLEGTTNAIKFKFQWETDIYQLGVRLHDLPKVTESIYD